MVARDVPKPSANVVLHIGVLFVVVVMNDACVLLVRWSGDVGLCRLVDSSVAVWWWW